MNYSRYSVDYLTKVNLMYIYNRQLSGFQYRRKKHPINLWSSEHDSLPGVTRVGGRFGGQRLGQVLTPSAEKRCREQWEKWLTTLPVPVQEASRQVQSLE